MTAVPHAQLTEAGHAVLARMAVLRVRFDRHWLLAREVADALPHTYRSYRSEVAASVGVLRGLEMRALVWCMPDGFEDKDFHGRTVVRGGWSLTSGGWQVARRLLPEAERVLLALGEVAR